MSFGTDSYDLNSIFERRQMEFVLGKRLGRPLESDEGYVIARTGDVVTDEVIRRSKREGKFTQLVMSVEPSEIGL
jgi:hypothetical protein